MSKSDDGLYMRWWLKHRHAPLESFEALGRDAFLAGRASLADEIAKLREQIEEVIDGMHYTDSRSAAKLQNILYGPPKALGAIESESASPDAGKNEVCPNCEGCGHVQIAPNARGIKHCEFCHGTGKRTEGK